MRSPGSERVPGGSAAVRDALCDQQFEQSMLMPVGGASDESGTLLDVLGLGGLDTWTPSLVVNPIPDHVTDVVVLGADGLSTMAHPR